MTNPPTMSRGALMLVGAALFLFGVGTTIDRAIFFTRSATMSASVLRQQRALVEVMPQGGGSTIWIERAVASRHGRLDYRPGRIVKIRADTTKVPPEAYMNSLYSLWFFPVGSILGGAFLFFIGYAMPRPWRLETSSH